MDAFLNPAGRTGRGGFWLAVIGLWGLAVLLAGIPVVGGFLVLALAWPMWVVHVRRLHDMGRSAWWTLIPIVIGAACLTGVILSAGKALNDFAMSEHGANAVLADAAEQGTLLAIGLGLGWTVVGFGFLLWLGLARGVENRAGQS